MRKYFLICLTHLVIGSITMAHTSEEPKGKISGTIFGTYFYNVARDTGIKSLKNAAYAGEKDVNGMSVQRALLNYDYRLSRDFTSRIAVESDEKNFTASADNKSYRFTMFLKDAWVQWRFHANHAVIVGLQATPPYGMMEGTWANRFLEKTILDLRGLVSTRELGVGLKGQFDSTGIVKYHLLIGNNSPSKPEDNKYKRFYGQVIITPIANLALLIYTDYQMQASMRDTFINKTVSTDILTNAFSIGYTKKDKLSAGVDVYLTNAKNAYNTGSALENKSGMGVSMYGTYYFSSKVAAVLRYDYFEPNSKTSGDTRQLFIVACNLKPTEEFTISPNVVVESYEKIGTRDIKESVTARISFNWSF
ncbi:MAG: hypothetical protein ACP5PZ_03315 [Bacteroidales bacterium]